MADFFRFITPYGFDSQEIGKGYYPTYFRGIHTIENSAGNFTNLSTVFCTRISSGQFLWDQNTQTFNNDLAITHGYVSDLSGKFIDTFPGIITQAQRNFDTSFLSDEIPVSNYLQANSKYDKIIQVVKQSSQEWKHGQKIYKNLADNNYYNSAPTNGVPVGIVCSYAPTTNNNTSEYVLQQGNLYSFISDDLNNSVPSSVTLLSANQYIDIGNNFYAKKDGNNTEGYIPSSTTNRIIRTNPNTLVTSEMSNNFNEFLYGLEFNKIMLKPNGLSNYLSIKSIPTCSGPSSADYFYGYFPRTKEYSSLPSKNGYNVIAYKITDDNINGVGSFPNAMLNYMKGFYVVYDTASNLNIGFCDSEPPEFNKTEWIRTGNTRFISPTLRSTYSAGTKEYCLGLISGGGTFFTIFPNYLQGTLDANDNNRGGSYNYVGEGLIHFTGTISPREPIPEMPAPRVTSAILRVGWRGWDYINDTFTFIQTASKNLISSPQECTEEIPLSANFDVNSDLNFMPQWSSPIDTQSEVTYDGGTGGYPYIGNIMLAQDFTNPMKIPSPFIIPRVNATSRGELFDYEDEDISTFSNLDGWYHPDWKTPDYNNYEIQNLTDYNFSSNFNSFTFSRKKIDDHILYKTNYIRTLKGDTKTSLNYYYVIVKDSLGNYYNFTTNNWTPTPNRYILPELPDPIIEEGEEPVQEYPETTKNIISIDTNKKIRIELHFVNNYEWYLPAIWGVPFLRDWCLEKNNY